MCISEDLLRSAGAVEQHYSSGDYIFRQDSFPLFYYYIIEGDVKLTNYAEDGKEFIQEIINEKSGIGEAMLILGKSYPINAIALSNCTILKIGNTQFFKMLQENPLIFKEIYSALANSTFEKQTLMYTITSKSAEDRIIEIMDLMKESQADKDKFSLEITYTRQQLASLSGLSLETTIRIIKKWRRKTSSGWKEEKFYTENLLNFPVKESGLIFSDTNFCNEIPANVPDRNIIPGILLTLSRKITS